MIGIVNRAASGETPAEASSRELLTGRDFIGLLTAELTTQDPLNPLDSGDMMQQLVGIQGLEQTARLNRSLETFQRFLHLSSGSSLIGRTVRGTDAQGQEVTGVVSGVVLEGDRVELRLDSASIPLESVIEILA